jgi:hypothetical protein
MAERREFLKKAGAAASAWMLTPVLLDQRLFGIQRAKLSADGLSFTSTSIQVELSKSAPEFAALNIDGLGLSKRGATILQSASTATGFTPSVSSAAGLHRIEYRAQPLQASATPGWTVELSDRRITLISQWSESAVPEPFVFRFDLAKCHSTVLGVFRKDGTLSVPALIHCPGQGSMRIAADASDDIGLTYESRRRSTLATLGFPAATPERKRIAYTLEVVAIYPEFPGLRGDGRFDSFRRNWLNVMQLNPFLGALANNTASTSCAFCYYEYADVAALTPPLAPGLTALDVVRQTLDLILAGGHAYGLPAPGNFPVESSDTLPALLISAANCVREGKNDQWLTANYSGLKKWAEKMMATDTDGDGLFKYAVSGNSGIWPDGFPTTRPSNWWDTIGFGHEDAYGNALAYRALREMEMMANRVGKPEDAIRYRAVAAKLRDVYYKTFYNPETGVLGGWRSADGRLHDYYFLWVNGIAIHYGLVPKDKANAIMDRLMAKMKEVGYDKFNMGLPGNLITVALEDYVHKDADGHHGGGVRPDNADGFQNYENGGATGCFAFFTLAALYDLGRKEEADRILFAMLGEYDKGGFEGRGVLGRSNDWRRWDGTPMGYEGFLTDNYYTLLAVPLRQTESSWVSGYRPNTPLT